MIKVYIIVKCDNMKANKTTKLLIIIASIITVAFSVVAVFVITREYDHIDKTIESNLMNVASILSTDAIVIEKIKNEDFSLNDHIDTFYEDVVDISSIIVMDQFSIQYSNPDDSLVGETFVGGDETRAINGESYLSIGGSARGSSIHAFVPIMDGDIQIGVVSVGYLESVIIGHKRDQTISIMIWFSTGIILSVGALWYLSHRYIAQLLGFQPAQIALLYAENRSLIEQLEEGIISVDNEYNITTINSRLKNMFHLDDDLVGRYVFEVFPYLDFRPIIEEEKQITNRHKKIRDENLLMNSFPLYLKNKVIGATATFRTRLEVDALLDQISGYQQVAEALRSQKHEFQNKLHVVHGLISMKDYEKAENYIMENVYTTNLASDYYSSRIKDDRILALFVGKEMQSKEINAQLMLTSDSYLSKKHHPITADDIVLVLGNLIDNSLEAYKNKDILEKRVVVDVFEDDDCIKFTVIDQAGGIDEKVIEHIFERGVSTKQGKSRGTGLSLVNEIVQVYRGSKNVQSNKEETKIEIVLMKVVR